MKNDKERGGPSDRKARQKQKDGNEEKEDKEIAEPLQS